MTKLDNVQNVKCQIVSKKVSICVKVSHAEHNDSVFLHVFSNFEIFLSLKKFYIFSDWLDRHTMSTLTFGPQLADSQT